MRLRYLGAVPVTFITGDVGEVEPGQEFEVADDVAARFLSRVDVEKVDTETVTLSKELAVTTTSTVDERPAEEPKLTTEEVCGIPDDH